MLGKERVEVEFGAFKETHLGEVRGYCFVGGGVMVSEDLEFILESAVVPEEFGG